MFILGLKTNIFDLGLGLALSGLGLASSDLGLDVAGLANITDPLCIM
jgi:hypothetical protein